MAKEFTTTNNALVVHLDGEIDQYAAANLKSKIDVEIEMTEKRNLIFDLGNVTLMDSSGIGLILGRYKLMQSLGGSMVLCNASASVKRIIELSGIGKVIPHYKSRDTADRSFIESIIYERNEQK